MKKFLMICVTMLLVVSMQLNAFAQLELEWVEDKPIAEVSVVSDGNGKWAVITDDGKIILDYSEYPKKVASNSLIAVLGENGFIGFYDRYGTQVTDFIYDAFIKYPEKSVVHGVTVGYLDGLFRFEGDSKSDLISVSYKGKFGYINSMGQVVIPYKYEYAYGFKNGIALICADGVLSEYGTYTQGKYGYLRENGEEILPPDSYWTATDINDEWGYGVASNGENDTILIDRHGNFAKCDATGYARIDAEFICVKKAGKYGVVDKYNRVIIPCVAQNEIYYRIGNVFIVDNTLRNANNEILYTAPENGYLDVQYKKNYFLLRMPNYRLGLVDVNGSIIIEPVYENISDLGGGLIFAGNGNKGHLFNDKGEVLTEFNAQIQSVSDNGIFKAFNYDLNEVKYYINPFVKADSSEKEEQVQQTEKVPPIPTIRKKTPIRGIIATNK